MQILVDGQELVQPTTEGRAGADVHACTQPSTCAPAQPEQASSPPPDGAQPATSPPPPLHAAAPAHASPQGPPAQLSPPAAPEPVVAVAADVAARKSTGAAGLLAGAVPVVLAPPQAKVAGEEREEGELPSEEDMDLESQDGRGTQGPCQVFLEPTQCSVQYPGALAVTELTPCRELVSW